jgi:hypothetical protein
VVDLLGGHIAYAFPKLPISTNRCQNIGDCYVDGDLLVEVLDLNSGHIRHVLVNPSLAHFATTADRCENVGRMVGTIRACRPTDAPAEVTAIA